jgi:succinate dehydrogenase subunit D
MMTPGWRNRGQAAYGAFLVHRISGLLLALFLPVHFVVLAQALRGEAALGAFLRWSQTPLVEASEVGLVFLLAAHLAGGLRLLLIEWGGWQRGAQPALLAAAGGVAAFCALAFALNLF